MSSGSICFDYVIGNPPFGIDKIAPIIKNSFDLAQSKGVIKLITTSTWLSLIAGIDGEKKLPELISIIKENKTSIELFNGNTVFSNASFTSSLCVVTIEKGVPPTKVKRVPQILVKGLLYGNEYKSIGYNEFNECDDVLRELFLDIPVHQTLTVALRALPEDWMDKPTRDRLFVNLPLCRGNVKKMEGLQYGLNWFEFFSENQLEEGEVMTRGSPKTKKPKAKKPKNSSKPKKSGEKKPFWFAFDSLDEANNFIDFLRYPLIRALAGVVKSYIKNDVFSNIPMPKDGFKRKYTEDELYKEFGLEHLKPTIESFFEKLNQIEQEGQASKAKAPKSSNDGKSKERKQENGEYFTPEPLVNQIIETVSQGLSIDDLVFEPSLGDGAFVLAVLKHKLQLETLYSKEEQAKRVLSSVYGCELMRDNLDKAKSAIRNMLISEYGIEESFYNNELSEIVDHNLVQVDTINPIAKVGTHKSKPENDLERFFESTPDDNFVQVDTTEPIVQVDTTEHTSVNDLQWPKWLIESTPDSYWLSYEFPPDSSDRIDHEYRMMLLNRKSKASSNNSTILVQL